MDIRLIKRDELADLLGLYKFLNPEDPEVELDQRCQDEWDSMHVDPRVFFYGAVCDGHIIGCAQLILIPNLTRGIRPFGLVRNVVTHPDYRGRGIGTALIQHINDEAWSKDCYQLLLQTERLETIGFYQSCGYRDDVKISLVAKPQ